MSTTEAGMLSTLLLPRIQYCSWDNLCFDDDYDGEGGSDYGGSDVVSSVLQERKIIVANQLPLKAQRDSETTKWSFEWDKDALMLQLKDGFSADVEVLYVGCLKVEINVSEQEEHPWSLFHYMLPILPNQGARFDRALWQAYVSANKIFADKIMEVINPDEDYVWIHDYHLMVLPSFLRKCFHRVKLGFFMHSFFSSSEIYRTLLVRDEILRSLLNSDLIGFHTLDYARHFLSCCSRMLGLDYESKKLHWALILWPDCEH
ncbi:hypothetical protein NE237_024821 [Protea cynaroides]|uniref:Trehalose-6-phosphate synthase n=1 Tax=Protea cynaroides TaxID=273540 RepID=A0A9Q0K0S4_9MAGN|nr:hypothetical protein NE237_024821 [Protea cynaroides]